MYLSILKHDLKRKKTMNIILLIFMTLSVMLVSSSINTVMSVASATDKFLDISGAKDYFVATMGTSAEKELDEKLNELDSVGAVRHEKILYLNENSLTHNGSTADLGSTGIINSIDDISTKVYTSDKKELTQVNDGDIYMKAAIMEENNISVGSKVTVRIGGTSQVFTVRGNILDVLFGSDMMGTPRFVISRNDFNRFYDNLTDKKYDYCKGLIYNIETSNSREVENIVSGIDGVAFTATRDVIKMTYIMDMIIAGIFLIVSVCLIIISIVLLRFTIGFTIGEEFREIGVMKAIGIKNSKIRTLYMIKYLAMAAVGAVIGFIAGIPFGNMLKEQSAKKIVTGEDSTLLINFLCALAVVSVIALFTWLSTRKVKKFTPVDAIRNGEGGKRYKKKGFLKLSRSKTRPVFFIAVNDILSGFRHFAVMTVTFVVGILLITILLNTISTLQSPKLMSWFSMAECDLAVEDKASTEKFTDPDGQQMRADYVKEMEKTLAENGIPAKCFTENIFKYSVQKGEYRTVTLSFIGTGTTTDMYSYIEGTPPQNTNEIALSYIIADRMDASIGDTITVKIGSEYREFRITALYQSMNNMGEGLRFHEDTKLDFSSVLGFFSYQIRFTDDPSESEIRSRKETISKLYPDCTVRTAGEFIQYSMGGIADMLGDTKNFVVIMVMLINILVVVLMEKSFIAKERGEIALMKALGFKERTLIIWQTLRAAIIMALSIIIAELLTDPVSQITSGLVFKMMGAKNIVFDPNILEAYILYPLAVFAITILAVVLSSSAIRGISSQEVNDIE